MSGLDLGALGLSAVDADGNPVAPAAPAAPPAAPAAPPAAPVAAPAAQPPAPALPEPPPADEPVVVPEGADNPDAVRNLINSERANARAAYARAKEAERRLAELAEAALPWEERVSRADARAQAAESNLIKFKVGLRHGLPEEITDLLRGSTEEELEAHAQSLLPRLNLTPAAPAAPAVPTPGAPPAIPVPTSGGYQTPPPAAKPNPAREHALFLGRLLTGQAQ